MQNIDKETKKVFVCPDGYTFVQADYSNLELRVLAAVSDDDVLQATFDRGENVHDANTRDLFNLEPTDKMWDAARRAAKTYIFGRNYGGSLQGIYERVSHQVPELMLTFKQFKAADARYRTAHPKYDEWREAVIAEVTTTRVLTNAFGRRRVFLGSRSEITRAGLNFPIQSTAADILNFALVSLYENLPSWARIAMTVHDSIVLEVPIDRAKSAAKLLKTHMEQQRVINNHTLTLPVDIETGPNLGELSELTI